MDIGSVEDLSAIQAVITRQQIDMAVLKKTSDTSETRTQAAIDLIESAAEITDRQQSQGNRYLNVKI